MDEKHRQYCIRLGNPYMKQEFFNEQFRGTEQADSSWIPETQMQNKDWIKNSKKFTN